VTLLLVACGVPCGLVARRRLSTVLPRLVRGQMLLLGTPVAFAAGLLFVPRFAAVVSMAALVAAEAAGVWVGGRLNARRDEPLIAATASASNTGIWSLPLAGIFFGPAAVAFVAVYDQMTFPRGLLMTARLRRFAPTPQVGRTAFVDYAPAAALLLGLALQEAFGRPHGLGPWLPRLGIAAAVVNMLLIGAAVPTALPAATHARSCVLGALFRFVPGVAALAALLAFGVHPPAAAWLLAFAPSYFTMLTMSRLYGYDGREAVATTLATTGIAAAVLPALVLALS
jgi:predicted permease